MIPGGGTTGYRTKSLREHTEHNDTTTYSSVIPGHPEPFWLRLFLVTQVPENRHYLRARSRMTRPNHVPFMTGTLSRTLARFLERHPCSDTLNRPPFIGHAEATIPFVGHTQLPTDSAEEQNLRRTPRLGRCLRIFGSIASQNRLIICNVLCNAEGDVRCLRQDINIMGGFGYRCGNAARGSINRIARDEREDTCQQ